MAWPRPGRAARRPRYRREPPAFRGGIGDRPSFVVWRDVFERHRILGQTAKLLGVVGRLQVAHDVTHLVAARLYAPDLVVPEPPPSRDFC